MKPSRALLLLLVFIVILFNFSSLARAQESAAEATEPPPQEISEPVVEIPTDTPPPTEIPATPVPVEPSPEVTEMPTVEPPPTEALPTLEAPTPEATDALPPAVEDTPEVETSEVPPAPVDAPAAEAIIGVEAVISPLVVANTNDSGAGSLRAAIDYANTNPGADTITFNIPGDGPHTIQPQSELPILTESTTIDGLSQPGASCATWPPTLKIELKGRLTIDGSNSTVRGLVINSGGLSLIASNVVVQCNFIGTDVTGTVAAGNIYGGITLGLGSLDNLIGGVGTGTRNLISGNEIGIFAPEGTANNLTIQGNYIGTDVTGQFALGNREGISVDTGGVTIGGTAPGAGNLISGNAGGISVTYDIDVLGENYGGVIQGNFIGTNADGTAAIPNGTGINSHIVPMLIGGTEPGARNLISGNIHSGVSVSSEESPLGEVQVPLSQVVGNYIGTDITGTRALGNGVGADLRQRVHFEGNVVSGNLGIGIYALSQDINIFNNTIGLAANSTQPLGNGGDGMNVYAFAYPLYGNIDIRSNIIANNGGNGITVIGEDPDAGVTISQNAIANNGKLGIDLGNDGVTLNDPGDSDRGINWLQNFPVITSAIVGTNAVSGTINTSLNWDIGIELFMGTCDPSGYGEGAVFIGSTSVHTDANGNASFSAATTMPLLAGYFVTATAGSSSEFSACAPITQTAPPAPTHVYPAVDARITVSRPSFTWSSVAGANRYRLQVFTIPGNRVINAESDFTSAAPSTLPQGVYFWRVQARDSSGNWGPFSAFRRFELNIQRAPASATDTSTMQPIFQWYSYAGAVRYQLQVDTDSNFYSPEFTCETTYKQALSCMPSRSQELPPGDWVWRVNVDTGNGFVPSPFYWRFTIQLNRLSPPGLTAPANGTTVGGRPSFSWTAVTGAAFYQIEISDNRDFINLILWDNLSQPSYTATSTLPPGLYYWRVRAHGVEFVTGGWSGVRTFRVG